MARIDDYNNAVALAKKELIKKNPDQIATLSGGTIAEEVSANPLLTIPFLNRTVALQWPDLNCVFKDSGEEVPVQQQVLIFHYLNGVNGFSPTGQWIAYQEIPDGRFYLDAFLRRAKNPMVQVFGSDPEKLMNLAVRIYGATPFDQGDMSVTLQAFPLVPVALILWRGDDEFPPEGTILFDRTISSILSAEDVAWLAGMIIYPLIGMSKGRE